MRALRQAPVTAGARLLRFDISAFVYLFRRTDGEVTLRVVNRQLPPDATFVGVHKVSGPKIWIWVRSAEFLKDLRVEIPPPQVTLTKGPAGGIVTSEVT